MTKETIIKLFVIIALSLPVLAGCVAPTKVKVSHHTVTDAAGVTTTDTDAEFEGLPRHWANLHFEWIDVLKLQGGEAVVVQPDYKGIIKEVTPGIIAGFCAANPIQCGIGSK